MLFNTVNSACFCQGGMLRTKSILDQQDANDKAASDLLCTSDTAVLLFLLRVLIQSADTLGSHESSDWSPSACPAICMCVCVSVHRQSDGAGPAAWGGPAWGPLHPQLPQMPPGAALQARGPQRQSCCPQLPPRPPGRPLQVSYAACAHWNGWGLGLGV